MAAADGTAFTERQPGSDQATRLRVFVSYSRNDTAFADELVAGLEYDGGFEVFLDRHSISEGEEWRERLGGLIAAADVVVFLLSKSSAASELCKWEADHAKELSKRIVPALIESVDGEQVAPTLKSLNYVRFDEKRSFMVGLRALRRALRADLGWIREHTRLLTRAQEWESAGRSENRLLSGADIVAAKEWIERRPPDAPSPLELHHAYIAASEQAEVARLSEDKRQAEELKNALRASRSGQRLTLGALLLAGVMAGAAFFMYIQTRSVGARAEAAVHERDEFIKGSEARESQLLEQIAFLQAENAANEAALSGQQPAASAEPPPPVVAPNDGAILAPLESRIAELRSKIEDLASARDEPISLPDKPVRASGETVRTYADRLEGYLAALDQQYMALLKSPAPQNRKRPLPEPYNPSILKQQSVDPALQAYPGQ